MQALLHLSITSELSCHSQDGHYLFVLWLVSHQMPFLSPGHVLCEGCLRGLTLEAETETLDSAGRIIESYIQEKLHLNLSPGKREKSFTVAVFLDEACAEGTS